MGEPIQSKESIKDMILKTMLGLLILRLLPLFVSLKFNIPSQIFFVRLVVYSICYLLPEKVLEHTAQLAEELPEQVVAVAALSSLICRAIFSGLTIDLITLPILTIGSFAKFIQGLHSIKPQEDFESKEEDDDEDEEGEDADWAALCAMEVGMLLGYYDASFVILLMLTGGEALEAYAEDNAKTSFREILELKPVKVTVDEDGERVEKDIDAVKKGDRILVSNQALIPVDGTLALKDTTSAKIDEYRMTGELKESKKYDGETVLAGTVNVSGNQLVVIASTTWDESLFKKYLDQLKEALTDESTKRLDSGKHEEMFDYFTLTLSFIAYTLHRFILAKTELQTWKIVLSVLMAATPCPLGIGVPVAFLSGMSAFSRKFKVTFKTAKAIEDLAKITNIIFDKTGTLTEGKLSVTELVELKKGELDNETVKKVIYSLELEASPHPIREAILGSFGVESFKVEQSSIKHHSTGISGVVLYDNMKLNVAIGADVLTDKETENEKNSNARTFFKIEETSNTGVIYFADTIRKSMKSEIQKLRAGNIKISVLSGDKSDNLRLIAEELDIPDYKVCTPDQKVEIIETLVDTNKKHVAMVGDGINDAGALKRATVGIAVGSGGLAANASDMVLIDTSTTSRLSEMIKLAKTVVRTARLAVGFGMTLACIQMVVASTGILSPYISAWLQEFIDLSTVLFALSVNVYF